MKMNYLRIVILSTMLLSLQSVFAQLRIEDCYQKAEANYPLIKQYDLIEKSKDYNLSNAGKGYLPQIQFSAKATYQSDVTKIPIDIPGVKGLSKDQYNASIDVSQVIWDGGNISSKREGIRTQSEIDRTNVEVSLYAIRERVNQVYFGILLYDEMLKQNDIYQKELQRNADQVTAYVQNGIANNADLDAVKIEQMKAVQQRTEFTHNRKSYLAILATLIGEKLGDDTALLMPDASYTSMEIQRPELSLFNAQIRNIESKKKDINASLMPQLSAFVTGGYGRPGLNMLENDFSPYYIAGVRLSWNIGSLYLKKNNLKSITTNQSLIESQREAFLFNLNLDITNKNGEIEKVKDLVKTDEEIVRLRESVRKSAETKAANGTLSILDLMKEVNAEQMAKQDKIMHQIQLIQAIYNLKYITNN